MSIRTVRLWQASWAEGNQKMLIESEVKEAVYVGEGTAVIETTATVEQLQSALDRYIEKHEYDGPLYEILEEAIEEAGIEADVGWSDGFEEADDRIARIAWDQSNGFYDFEGLENSLIYEWFDGSNHRVEELSFDYGSETVVEIFKEYVDLDEWDGRNHVTGGMGHHQRVYRVYTVDGEVVSDTYLLERWSQWQGDHATGELMSRHELSCHLEELERDVKQYMTEVQELGN